MSDNPTVNEQFLDGMISHQIGLLRVAGGTSKKAIEILNKTETKLRETILAKLSSEGGDTKQNRKKAESLILLLLLLRKKAWAKIAELFNIDMKAIALNEPNYVKGLAIALSPVVLSLAGFLTTAQVNDIVRNEPFEGRTLSQWAKDTAAADSDRIAKQIRIGVVQGDGAQVVAQRIVGTKAAKGADGILEIARQNVKALVRTATNFFANKARREFVTANVETFAKELYVAVLDSRTTPICRSLDHNIYEVGIGPIPPLHMNCRSMRIPYFDAKSLQVRPMTTTTERQLALEFSNGEAKSRSALPRMQRKRFDDFAEKRIGQLVGFAPKGTSYQAFLKRQPKWFQIEVLGKAKQKLFADGGLTLDKFVNRQGDELTLKQLAKIEHDAFIKAGLNPNAY